MEQLRKDLLKQIRKYRGELYVSPRLGAQLENDSSISMANKAFIWFDRHVMRFEVVREFGRHPWYHSIDGKTGETLEPLIDFIYDESKWPRHITKFADLENFLIKIDWYYHSHCLDDLIHIVDCPRLGDGHLMIVPRRKCRKLDVMRKVFGILEHYESWDFNVLVANEVSSLFQNKTDEMYGEGSQLFFIALYMNTGPNAPFIWTDVRYKKATKTSVSKHSKVKISVPTLDEASRTPYLEIGPPLEKPFDEWVFYETELFDGVVLKCKGDVNDTLEKGEEILVDYNFGRERVNDNSSRSRFDRYNYAEGFRVVAEKKKFDRSVQRMEKLQGLSRRNKVKAQKEQERAEKADHEKRRSVKRDKMNKFLKEYADKGSDEDSDDFMDNHSICSDSTNSFNEDLKNTSVLQQVTSSEHEKWMTADDYKNEEDIDEEGDVGFLSTQYYDKADMILAKVKSDCPVNIIDLTKDSTPEEKKIKRLKEKMKVKKQSREYSKSLDLSSVFNNNYQEMEQMNDFYISHLEDEERRVEEEIEDVVETEVEDNVGIEEETLVDDTTVSTLTGKGVGTGEDEQEEQEALDRGVLTQLQVKKSPTKRRLSIVQIRQMNMNKKKKND